MYQSGLGQVVWIAKLYSCQNYAIYIYIQINLRNHPWSYSRPARGGGGKIPGTRSAQRDPEISVKCSYCLSSLYVCPK
jgi:hypothetical protein